MKNEDKGQNNQYQERRRDHRYRYYKDNRKYFEQLSINKFDNANETNKCLKDTNYHSSLKMQLAI